MDKSTKSLLVVTGIGMVVTLLFYLTMPDSVTRLNFLFLPVFLPSVDKPLGSVCLMILLILYAGWFVHSTKTEENIPLRDAVVVNLKTNPAIWGMIVYYLVFGYALIEVLIS